MPNIKSLFFINFIINASQNEKDGSFPTTSLYLSPSLSIPVGIFLKKVIFNIRYGLCVITLQKNQVFPFSYCINDVTHKSKVFNPNPNWGSIPGDLYDLMSTVQYIREEGMGEVWYFFGDKSRDFFVFVFPHLVHVLLRSIRSFIYLFFLLK